MNSKIKTKVNEILTAYLSYCMNEKELVLSLLDIYFKALTFQINNKYYIKIVQKTNEQFIINKRLFNVGNISKIELLKSSFNLANLYNKKINNEKEKNEYFNTISNISNYELSLNESLELFSRNARILKTSFLNTINGKLTLSKIKILKSEYELLKKEYYPNLNFYSKYDFYGSDKNSYKKSFKDVKTNSYKFGLILTWEIFSGFKTFSQREKKSLEIKQLYSQYDLLEYNFNSALKKINTNYKFEKQSLHYLDESLYLTTKSQYHSKRLNKLGEMDSFSLLNYEIEKLYKELEQKIANEKISYLQLKKEILLKDSKCIVP